MSRERCSLRAHAREFQRRRTDHRSTVERRPAQAGVLDQPADGQLAERMRPGELQCRFQNGLFRPVGLARLCLRLWQARQHRALGT